MENAVGAAAFTAHDRSADCCGPLPPLAPNRLAARLDDVGKGQIDELGHCGSRGLRVTRRDRFVNLDVVGYRVAFQALRALFKHGAPGDRGGYAAAERYKEGVPGRG